MPRVLSTSLRDRVDWVLLGVAAAIAVIGVINLYSTGIASNSPDLYLTQLYWLTFGGVLAFAVAVIDYRHYDRIGYIIYGVGNFLLLLVLIVGTEVNGSTRWISFGEAWRFQPSEIMKVCLVVGLAKYLYHDPTSEGRGLWDLLIPTVMTLVPMVLILEQPDLGTALLCMLIFFSIMLLTRLKARSMLGLLVSAPVVAMLGWSYLLRDYQKERVISFWNSFVDPEADRLGSGWHAYQSTVAIGSGQWTGKGYLHGTAGPHHFLPEARTDFPFSVFAEEHGFLGAALLLALYFILIMWSIRIAASAKDRFGAILAIGVASVFFWHVLINMGMVMGIMPVVGVTLPLFSYGGSSVLAFTLCVGLLMNVSIHRFSR
ncbi:MAG: rod shape-determining protein RodA [Myxococcota bacterium]|nr:rod shape-determining protein RodA [Myxococcota bacterium]